MSTEAPAVVDIPVGTDNRPHHPYGFSFIGSLEKCPAARRSHVSAKNLAAAGERGTELHAVLEEAVKQWMKNVENGSNAPFLHVLSVKAHEMAVSPDDARSVMKIGEEIAVYFVNDAGLAVGTEEMIEVKDPVSGAVRTFGWYDIILMIEDRALIVDHKFVRKEVELAEKNRQGHALAVGVFQTYPQINSVEVLFSMPECQSSRHTFTRAADFKRLEAEVIEILDAVERPYKVLRAGEQCNYCKFRGDCPAALKSLQTFATAIEPMSAPKTFLPDQITDPADMALLRHWCSVLEPIIEAVKGRSLEMAQQGHRLIAGDSEYKLYSRSAPRVFSKGPNEVFEAVKNWMPQAAFTAACKLNVGAFEKVAVQVIADRLISQGKRPNLTQIGKDLSAEMVKQGLMLQEGTKIPYLKKVKLRAEKAIEHDDHIPVDSDDS